MWAPHNVDFVVLTVMLRLGLWEYVAELYASVGLWELMVVHKLSDGCIACNLSYGQAILSWWLTKFFVTHPEIQAVSSWLLTECLFYHFSPRDLVSCFFRGVSGAPIAAWLSYAFRGTTNSANEHLWLNNAIRCRHVQVDRLVWRVDSVDTSSWRHVHFSWPVWESRSRIVNN